MRDYITALGSYIVPINIAIIAVLAVICIFLVTSVRVSAKRINNPVSVEFQFTSLPLGFKYSVKAVKDVPLNANGKERQSQEEGQ